MSEPGGPEVLSVGSVPVPTPVAGEIRVRVATSGVNRADLLQRTGGLRIFSASSSRGSLRRLALTWTGGGKATASWAFSAAVDTPST